MSKEDLIKKIKDFLDDCYLSSNEVDFWREKIDTLPEVELMDLLPLLQEKDKILQETGDFLLDTLDQAALDNNQRKQIPATVGLVGKPLNDIADIFKNDLLKWLNDPEVDLLKQLVRHYDQQIKMGRNNFSFSLVGRNVFENTQKLFEKSYAVRSMTVGDWVKAYQASNNKAKRGGLDRLNFVNQNEKAKKLTEVDRAGLLKLLKIVDFLKNPSSLDEQAEVRKVPAAPIASSVSAEKVDLGVSQSEQKSIVDPVIKPDPKLVLKPVLKSKDGLVVKKKIEPLVAPIATAKYSKEDILKKYQENQVEVDQIASYAVDKQNQFSNNMTAIHQALYQAVEAQSPDRREVLSLIYLLSKLGSLGTVLKGNDSMNRLLQNHLQYEGQTQLLNDFKLHPGDPKFVSWLLSHILQDRLKMDENEAARFGLRLNNLSKQVGDEQFGQLAYFDMDSGKFRWKK